MVSRPKIEFRLTPNACIFGALALLILPLRWIVAALLAAGFHEFCHILALRLCGVRVYRLCVGGGGAVIDTEPMGEGRQLICALAGPVGSVLLLLLIRWFPITALCAGVQGLYNLLPIYPLDGGRVLSSVLGMICPRHREIIMKWVDLTVITVIIVLAVYGFIFLRVGIGVLFIAAMLLGRTVPRKTPCKES